MSDNDTMRQAAEREAADVMPAEFAQYVARNYSGEVVFSDPMWHAIRLWRAAMWALRRASHPAPAEASPEPVAWGAFVFGGKRDGKLYSFLDTKADAEHYAHTVEQSRDDITLRIGPLYASAAPAEGAREPLTEEHIEEVTEEAQRSLRRYCSGVRGQTITLWDGIEAHVVRATERAHGIAARGIAGIQATKGD